MQTEQVYPVLNGRYRALKMIGEGSMGKVFLAEDRKLYGKKWAIKQVETGQSGSALREVEMLSQLDHPRLPKVSDLFFSSDGKRAYIVMDYIEGENLYHLFENRARSLTITEVLQYALQICELFQYLHETHDPPLLHRDLKPENIMVDANGQIKVIDFGIARPYKKDRKQETQVFATPGFASPEQRRGEGSDMRSDLYALGALMFYLLTGGRYVPEMTSAERDNGLSHISSDVRGLILKLLENEPAKRYQTAAHVRLSLEQLLIRQSPVSQTWERKIQRRSTPVIGCRGVAKGSGCTHAAMMIAHALAKKSLKVALVECAERPAFFQLFGEAEHALDDHYISYRGVDYYRKQSELRIQHLIFAGYDALVVDFGAELNSEREAEYVRADFPLLVSFAGKLAMPQLQQFLATTALPEKRWQLALVCATDDAHDRQMHMPLPQSVDSATVLRLPVCPDPAQIRGNTEHLITEWLQTKPKSSFFSVRRMFTYATRMCNDLLFRGGR